MDCDQKCQKILLCMLCAAFDLLAQSRAQLQWKKDGQPLSDDFKARQLSRMIRLQVILDECYAIVGDHPKPSPPLSLKSLSSQLEWLSKPRGLKEAKQVALIDKSEEIESIGNENQADYLNSIGYMPTPELAA